MPSRFIVVAMSLVPLVIILVVDLAQRDLRADAQYRAAATMLIDAALHDDTGFERLTYLTTQIGHRLSGEASLDRAIAWVADGLTADGLANVRKQPVQVPKWSAAPNRSTS